MESPAQPHIADWAWASALLEFPPSFFAARAVDVMGAVASATDDAAARIATVPNGKGAEGTDAE